MANEYSSERRGGGLRVYLNGPWYSSGAGEMLAVVCRSESSSVSFEKLEPFVSHWGRDPLWQSRPRPTILRAERFRNAAQVANVYLRPDDVTAGVTIAAYPMKIKESRCFCDIELDPEDSYYPFVRLALARFQPHSIAGVELSRVVMTDFMQLAPHRAVAVVRQGANQLTVTVSGPTHQSHADPFNPDGRVGTLVGVRVQERIRGTSDEAGWLPSGQAVITPTIATATDDLLWQGGVTLPSGRIPGQFRLLVEEREMLTGVLAEGYRPQDKPASRVVFAESVEL
jgi:hypothetical protein